MSRSRSLLLPSALRYHSRPPQVSVALWMIYPRAKSMDSSRCGFYLIPEGPFLLNRTINDRDIIQAEYASTPFLFLTMALVKWSICVFINHLSPTAIHRHVDIAFRSTIGLWLVSSTVVSIFQCGLPRPWDYIDRTGCTNRVRLSYPLQCPQDASLTFKASLVDVRQCTEHDHRVRIRVHIHLDYRKASHIGSEKNHCSFGFLD